MLVLDATDEQIQIVLAAAVTTNQLEFNSSYKDWVAGTPSLTPVQQAGTSNSTTDVDIVTAPAASTQRQVLAIAIYNKDTVAATVTVKHDKAATERIIGKFALQVDDSLHYEDGRGWYALDAFGCLKSTILSLGSFIKTTVKTSGTTFVTDARTRLLLIRLIGGGGAGGGCTSAASQGGFGGGGSSGGYLEKVISVQPSTTYTVQVGAAGTGSSGADGGAGTTTTFAANGITYTAQAGLGGINGATAVTGVALGGAAPAVSTNGDMNGTGCPGEPGFWSAASTGCSGRGGGVQGFGGGGNSRKTTGAGNIGVGYGAGGGGAAQNNNGGAAAGGDGTAGVIIVEEYA